MLDAPRTGRPPPEDRPWRPVRHWGRWLRPL